MRGWSSNHRRGPYHRERADWIQSGKAACGANISRPGWTTGAHHPAAPLKTCKHCEKRKEQS